MLAAEREGWGIGNGRFPQPPRRAILIHKINLLAHIGRRPGWFRHPASGPLRAEDFGRHGLLHPGAQHRLVHNAGLDALEPVIPPAQALLQKADGRTGHAHFREIVRPGANQPFARPGQPGQQARNRVIVIVRPAADGVDGNVDGRVGFANGAVFPVDVAALVTEPGCDVGRRLFQTFLPHLAPILPDEARVGWGGVGHKHDRGPGQHLRGEQAAAHVMHVVGEAVVGEVHGDDGFELRRAAGGDLQGVEAAPRFAKEADVAGAPGLVGDPGQHGQGVVLLLG